MVISKAWIKIKHGELESFLRSYLASNGGGQWKVMGNKANKRDDLETERYVDVGMPCGFACNPKVCVQKAGSGRLPSSPPESNL